MNVVTLIYLIAFALAIVNIVLLVESGVRPNIYTVLLMCSVVVSNFGYLAVSVSRSVDAAVIANCFIYLGGCYLPFFVFCIGADMTKIRIPHIIRFLMFLFSTFLVALSFTVGNSSIYYKSINIADAGGYTVLIKEYGPLHLLYIALLGSYIIASGVMCVLAFVKRSVVSYKTTIMYFLFLAVNVVIYALSRIFKIEFEWNCFGYLVSELIILAIYNRLEMYDMSYNVMRTWEKMEEYAYIVFDRKKQYLGSNDLARQYFEDLKTQEIDMKLKDGLGRIQKRKRAARKYTARS